MSESFRRREAVYFSMLAGLLLALTSTPSLADPTTHETILFVRHGEKPADGLGQLSCKGLNRALALPAVLKTKYGHLDAVFAPDPSHQKPDGEASYDYVRPLATVEPAAIEAGLPIRSALGYTEIDPLRDALLAAELHDKVVLVGWEHHMLNKMVPALLASFGGDAARVPKWESDDFDTIWRLTIDRTGGAAHAAFAVDRQGLDNLPSACPTGR